MNAEAQTVRVLAARLPEAREALDKLVKKARRYGCPDLAYTVGETVTESYTVEEWDGERRKVTVEYNPLTITGEPVRVGNHEFLARVELLDGGNLVDSRPGVEDLDPRFRHTNGYCVHCNSVRRRKDVFVVRNTDTGEQVQVGRDCLRDYMGVDPVALTHRFSFWNAVRGFEEDERGHGGRAEWGTSLEGAMILSAVCVRLFGWCSKGQAQYDENLRPTSSYVWTVLNPPIRADREERALIDRIKAECSDADRDTARAVIAWVRDELAADSDYCHNLKVIFGGDTIRDTRRLGLAVSAIAAYHRAKEQELRRTKEREAAKVSEHLGKVGERIRDLPVTLQLQRIIGGNEWADSVLIKFVDDHGNILTWITSKGSGLEVGEKALLTGTVKAHGEYNGALETKMTRCVLKEVA